LTKAAHQTWAAPAALIGEASLLSERNCCLVHERPAIVLGENKSRSCRRSSAICVAKCLCCNAAGFGMKNAF
jgi:hypothetical protein